MRPRLALLAAVLIASAAFADTPKAITATEALTLLEDAFKADQRTLSTKIDRSDLSLQVKGRDGTKYIVSPDNLMRTLQFAQSDKDREAVLKNYVEAMYASTAPRPADAQTLKRSILPVVRSDQLTENIPDEARAISVPLVADLREYYVLDSEAFIKFASRDQIRELGLDPSELRALAWDNFATRFPHAQIKGDGLFTIALDGTYETSLLLDRGLWEDMDKKLGQVIAAAPNRDILIFADRSVEGSEAALRKLVDEWYDTFDHPVSKTILLWDGARGWVPLR